MNFTKKQLKRIQRTVSVRDCDYIPKVSDAGQIRVENDQKIQIMHNGLKVIHGGYHGDWMAKIIATLKGHHEPQEEKVFYEILKHIPKTGTMLELGCFWAYYSAWFNSEIEDAKNYLVEPITEKLELGRITFSLNKMNGEFHLAFVDSSSAEEESFVDWDGTVYKIQRICVDDFLKKEKIGELNILHADIQGAELSMLEGATDSLSNKKIQFIIISTHGSHHNACLESLINYKYNIIASHTIEESASADGLIVAQSSNMPKIKGVDITRI